MIEYKVSGLASITPETFAVSNVYNYDQNIPNEEKAAPLSVDSPGGRRHFSELPPSFLRWEE